MKCTVCNHPQCHDIDLALITRSHTLDVLKQQFGPSRSALHRHKKHLLKKLDRAEESFANTVRLGYLFRLNTYLEETSATVKTAREEGNSRLGLQALNSGTRIINFMNKLDVSVERDLVYRLMASPQWTQPGCALPADPHILADSRAAQAQNLFSFCPDADPEELEDFHPRDRRDSEDEKLPDLPDQDGSIAAAPETLAFESRQLELGNFLIQAAAQMLSETPPAARETSTENQPRNKREISEKLPGKNDPCAQKPLIKQELSPSKKNLPPKPASRQFAIDLLNGKRQTSKGNRQKTVSDLCPGLDDHPRWTSTLCRAGDARCEDYLLEKAALGINDAPADPLPRLAAPPASIRQIYLNQILSKL